MNYSNGRMWDEYDKAMSRITDLEEELEKANARAEAAEAKVASRDALIERLIDVGFDVFHGMAYTIHEKHYDEIVAEWKASKDGGGK